MDATLVTYSGGTRCGAVRFTVTVDKHEASDCNCSICKKKGFLHLIVPPERFTLLCGEDVLTTYTFNTGTAKHTFCRICGIHSFYRPRSHPDQFDVNVRCLDDCAVSQFQILPFEGVNWEQNVHLLHDESNLSS
ncbi:MAG: GFA family protein [Microcoleus sp. PH2017_10_PVI_O_A]|uniref:GFA family protein n=1 Tax=unclassified Microcoleus TaxID=2642155 RepID=UPI001DC39F41|nr:MULTISPECIES: GFA family protein [unclassified Microcoleus]TAE80835.1 MAG: GFA family protein [Oscillatoriales cyanobacterium]MCC3407784.1 GFA family protein [Microcoleus sp. PH2017_10_PVI_O_A]MCC3461474.1 GFA family protein [Microcoleus sp. PH2017_11_PCY_U_A]MCC3479948.1 GFA family protein [Microcoleus sp. PH2017_12_PCY_D_A]MCC3528604.1 GFA family protein [Microcoleus sp. PH2017_21_RUC_O_A]